jgi:hypothetical protein
MGRMKLKLRLKEDSNCMFFEVEERDSGIVINIYDPNGEEWELGSFALGEEGTLIWCPASGVASESVKTDDDGYIKEE